MLNCVWNKVVRKSMLVGWLVFLGWLVPHEALALNLTVSDVSGPNFSFHGLKLSGDGYDKTGPLHLSIAQLSILGQHLYHVQLDCTSFQWTSQKLRCRGELGIALQRYRLRLFYRFDSHMLQLTLKRPHQQFRLKAKLSADWQIKAKWNGVRLDMLDHLLLLAHHVKITSGRFSGVALVSGKHKQIDQMRVQMAIHNMAFSDASGNHAADKEQFHVLFAASRRSQALDWAATVRSEQGELYFQPVYLNQAGDSFKVKGTYSYGRWKLAKASLFVPGAGKLSASGEIDFFPFKIHQVNLVSSKISLARAWPVFVAPFVAPDSVLSDSVASGYLGFMAKIHEGQPVQLHVQLFNVSLVNHGKSWAIRDVSADFPWDQHRARTASVHFGLSHWRKIPFGPAGIQVVTRGLSFQIKTMDIPVVDGQLKLRNATGEKQGSEWKWSVGGELKPVSMKRLSQELGWPSMSGAVSARIPVVTYAHHRLDLGGVVKANVFNGAITIGGLEITHPFDNNALLRANFDAEKVDLGLMTHAFSFGSIEGLMDARVSNLVLYDWRPLYFNATIESSQGHYRKRISQEAVKNITALGGSGAGAAIQQGILRFFHTFGYSRIGLSCALRAGVCHMGGIKNMGNGFVIISGGGVPSLTVVGHNREVDWQVLVDRLIAATSGKLKPVIH